MKLIPLTQGQFAKVDDEDYDELMKHKWYAWWSKNNKTFYAVRNKKKGEGKRGRIYMHRAIMYCPDNMHVDHKNHDGLDNRRLDNLRICSPMENMQNLRRPVTNKSGYKGVHFSKANGRWCSQIRHNNNRYNLGYFDTPQEAHKAYCQASDELRGDFSCHG